jgi:hypothetical protein
MAHFLCRISGNELNLEEKRESKIAELKTFKRKLLSAPGFENS